MKLSYCQEAPRLHYSSTITSRNQITLPTSIRKAIQGNKVEFILEGETIILRPVPDSAGALSQYGGDYIPLEEVREKVWGIQNEDNTT